MKILFVETFFKGSHKTWANELKRHLIDFDFHFLTDNTSSWKEAMTLATEKLPELDCTKFDLVLLTSMVNVVKFKIRYNIDAPHIIYFHENQRAYPWTKNGNNNKSAFYSDIQLKSANIADYLLFNSKYNLKTFCLDDSDLILKSEVLPIGVDTEILKKARINKIEGLTIIWNHRWEYDKNPALFFETLRELKKDISFKLIITGESPEHVQNIVFSDAKEEFKDNLIHFGYAKSKEDYYKLLWQSHLSIVTSNHDFFGISVCESVLCKVHTILPNRLAYPEHFKTHENFYDNDEKLIFKVKAFIKDKKLNDNHNVESYDWNNLKSNYIEMFKKLGSIK